MIDRPAIADEPQKAASVSPPTPGVPSLALIGYVDQARYLFE
jgi:hypothetical protein